MVLATRQASACVAVVWQRRPYRKLASFRMQFTPGDQSDQRLAVSLSYPQEWRPPSALPIAAQGGTQTCSGRVAPGQSLWVRIDNAKGESQAATWLVYGQGVLQPTGQVQRLALSREGPASSWAAEQSRLAIASALLCGLATLLVLAAQLALPLSPGMRQIGWVCVLLLLWQGGRAFFSRQQFRLGRVIPALCILVTGILYLLLSLFPHLPL